MAGPGLEWVHERHAGVCSRWRTSDVLRGPRRGSRGPGAAGARSWRWIDDRDELRCADPPRHCCSCCDRVGSRQTAAMRTRRPRSAAVARSAFAGFCFPPDVIVLAVRWYLRFALSYRDVEELLAERGIQVDHVTISRWVQRFTPLLAEAARPC